MNTNIDMEQLAQDADNIFHQGFACSESVIYAIRKNFEIDLSDDGGGCICGALAGGAMCIGYFFGRRTPGS